MARSSPRCAAAKVLETHRHPADNSPMFTGLVEATGVIQGIRASAKSIALAVLARACARGTRPGDSIAVNGCCLTVVKLSGRGAQRSLHFDLLRETWDRTSFAKLRVGNRVNLERSLAVGQRLGGHFVTGHVDGTGRIVRWEASGADWVLEVAAPKDVLRFVIHKGSIAVDGISLTVAKVSAKGFTIWIIPHTREVTALKEKAAGDAVNLEADLLGKYVEQFVRPKRR
jgi:riboflavin synthase